MFLEKHTQDLLGPRPATRIVRIMVTMPTEAATDQALIESLMRNGMDCLRINCAHDGPDVWERMVANLRGAEQRLGRKCRVLMDLAGPKLRTGPLVAGPEVVKWRPRRDTYGRVTAPARIWLYPSESPVPSPAAAAAAIPVPGHGWPNRGPRMKSPSVIPETDPGRCGSRKRLGIAGGRRLTGPPT